MRETGSYTGEDILWLLKYLNDNYSSPYKLRELVLIVAINEDQEVVGYKLPLIPLSLASNEEIVRCFEEFNEKAKFDPEQVWIDTEWCLDHRFRGYKSACAMMKKHLLELKAGLTEEHNCKYIISDHHILNRASKKFMDKIGYLPYEELIADGYKCLFKACSDEEIYVMRVLEL